MLNLDLHFTSVLDLDGGCYLSIREVTSMLSLDQDVTSLAEEITSLLNLDHSLVRLLTLVVRGVL